jgi:hypothetical protein
MRLVNFLEKNSLLDDAQSGFRPDRGTAHKLLAISAITLEAHKNKKELHILSNDSYKCFDSIELVRRNMLAKTMHIGQVHRYNHGHAA